MTWENTPSTATPRNATNLNKGIFGDTQYGGTISSNFNTITKNGYYTGYGTATGAPNTSYSWFVHHQNSNAGTVSATQRAVAYKTGEPIIMERVKQSSTWGNWYNPLQSGWNYVNGTFTYSSYNSTTYTGVVNSNLDLTSYLSVGMKIKFTQNSTIKYAFITAITSTQLTLFLGTDYTINNSAISNTYYSMLKTPYGFPIKYSQEIYSTTEQVVGMWIDGKPIYRKVLNIGTPSGSATFPTHGINKIKNVIKLYGYCYTNGYIRQIIPMTYTNWEIFAYDITDTGFTLKFSANQWSANPTNVSVVFEYTKTTD